MIINSIRFKSGNDKLRRPEIEELKALTIDLKQALHSKGYSAFVSVENSTCIHIAGQIRLTPKFVETFGKNLHMNKWDDEITYRRTTTLNHDQYIIVNNTINQVLDVYSVSANVSSMHGNIIIRKGFDKYDFKDWENYMYSNVGSDMYPILWMDQNVNEHKFSVRDFELFKEV